MANGELFNFTIITGEGLTSDVRDGVIRTLLTNEGFADVSQREAREIFRQAGFAFRDSVFNNIYNDVLGLERQARRIGSLDFTQTPFDSHFAPSRYPLPKNYRYTVRYDYVESGTGLIKTSHITMDSNNREVIGDILDKSETYIAEKYLEFVGEVVGYQVVRGYRNR